MSFEGGTNPEPYTRTAPVPIPPREGGKNDYKGDSAPIVSPWLHGPSSVGNLFGWGKEHGTNGLHDGDNDKEHMSNKPLINGGNSSSPVEVVEEEGVEEWGGDVKGAS